MTFKKVLMSIIIIAFLGACENRDNELLVGPSDTTNPEKRPFEPKLNGNWIGNGISYSAYRDGENPDDNVTSKAHILEDMKIMAEHWNLIRIYGAGPQAENILAVIREHNLPIRVMQGIWLGSNETDKDNQFQVDDAIRLANEYRDIVVAVNVGNEIFVDWAVHRIDDMDSVIEKIRQVRANISQPVTVSDDYNFWNKPHAQKVAAELDFICLHAYAFWNDQSIDVSMQWTIDVYNDIQSRHPDHTIAYCETGWPTSRIWNDGSYEGGLRGVANEDNQAIFFQQYNAWIEESNIISFYFTSFDEKWKGGMDGVNPMEKAEKHWGLYFSDRSPKKVLQK